MKCQESGDLPFGSPCSRTDPTYVLQDGFCYAICFLAGGRDPFEFRGQAIGPFDVSGSEKAGWYLTSEAYDEAYAWGQRFSDGYQGFDFKDLGASLRCVRG